MVISDWLLFSAGKNTIKNPKIWTLFWRYPKFWTEQQQFFILAQRHQGTKGHKVE
jgi:hypothetical protein